MSLINLIPNGRRWVLMQELAKSGVESVLSPSYGFRYAKIKGSLLVFAFSNPLVKTEFNGKKELIKIQLRNHYKKHLKELKNEGVIFTDIHCMYIAEKTDKFLPLESPDTNLFLEERSKGEFVNNATGELHEIFEDIRKAIKEKKR